MRTIVVTLLTVPLLVLAPAPPARAAGTCQGQPATIESSTPGATLTGTEGPDVILATASATINALGGDDTVCAAGGVLDAGAGNDTVVVTQGSAQEAYLGAGVNRYTSTGGTTDHVHSGTAGEPNRDFVDTGVGYDELVADLPAGSQLQARASHAGYSTDPVAQVVLRGLPGDTGQWSLLLPGALTRDGATVATVTGFNNSYLDLPATASAFVHGTAGDDRAYVSAGRIDVALGKGDDVLAVGSSASDDESGAFEIVTGAVPTEGRVNLGNGSGDRLYVESPGTVNLDLARGRLGKVRVAGIEDSSIWARKAVYTGSSRSDDAVAWACRATLRGGAGDDFLGPVKTDLVLRDLGCAPRFTLYGGGGDDELKGDDRNDVLVGGRGRDRANGHGGVDACDAEIEHNCER